MMSMFMIAHACLHGPSVISKMLVKICSLLSTAHAWLPSFTILDCHLTLFIIFEPIVVFLDCHRKFAWLPLKVHSIYYQIRSLNHYDISMIVIGLLTRHTILGLLVICLLFCLLPMTSSWTVLLVFSRVLSCSLFGVLLYDWIVPSLLALSRLWVGRFLCSHTMCIVVRIWIRCTSSISGSHDELVVGLLLFALPVCFNNYPRFRFSISLVVHRQPYLEMLGFRHDRFLDCRILHVGIPFVYAMLYYYHIICHLLYNNYQFLYYA